MVRLSRSVLRWSVLLLCLTGCQSLPINPWASLPPPPSPLTSVAPVWEHLQTRRQTLDNLRGLARARLQVSTRDATLEEAVIVLQRFESLRLEGLGPLNQPLFLLIADAQRLALYAPQERRLLRGEASAENMTRLFGIAMTPSALQYVLAGDIPLHALPTVGTFAYQRRENLYFWQGQVPGQPLTYRMWFEPYDLHPVRFEADNIEGRLLLQIWYEDFRRVQGFRVPYRITLVQPIVGRQVVWEYRDVELNVQVLPSLFNMLVPAGTTQVEVESLLEPEADRLPRIW